MHYFDWMSKSPHSIQLKVTERGQVTVRKEVLRHLGVSPGDKLELTLLPGGRAELRAPKRTGKISDIFGMLRRKTNSRVVTIEEMKAATEIAAAEGVMAGLRKK